MVMDHMLQGTAQDDPVSLYNELQEAIAKINL